MAPKRSKSSATLGEADNEGQVSMVVEVPENLNQKIDNLKTEQKRLRQLKKEATAAIKLAGRKKNRIMKKVTQLSQDDLVCALHMRIKKKEASAKEVIEAITMANEEGEAQTPSNEDAQSEPTDPAPHSSTASSASG